MIAELLNELQLLRKALADAREREVKLYDEIAARRKENAELWERVHRKSRARA